MSFALLRCFNSIVTILNTVLCVATTILVVSPGVFAGHSFIYDSAPIGMRPYSVTSSGWLAGPECGYWTAINHFGRKSIGPGA